MYWFDFKPDIYREVGFVIRYLSLVQNSGLIDWSYLIPAVPGWKPNPSHRKHCSSVKEPYFWEGFPFLSRSTCITGQSQAGRNDPHCFGASQKSMRQAAGVSFRSSKNRVHLLQEVRNTPCQALILDPQDAGSIQDVRIYISQAAEVNFFPLPQWIVGYFDVFRERRFQCPCGRILIIQSTASSQIDGDWSSKLRAALKRNPVWFSSDRV